MNKILTAHIEKRLRRYRGYLGIENTYHRLDETSAYVKTSFGAIYFQYSKERGLNEVWVTFTDMETMLRHKNISTEELVSILVEGKKIGAKA